jgi:hypothetical protein
MNREKRKEYSRLLRIARKKDDCEYQRKYKKEHPGAVVAHNAIAHRVFANTISKPDKCEKCGGGYYIDGHHPDYNKPLGVVWLCRSCHNYLRAKEL